MIRTVLFDLDDTLFDHHYSARSALSVVRAMHVCFEQMGISDLEAAHATIQDALHLEVMVGRLDLDVARVERFRQLYRAAGVEPDTAIASRTAAAYRKAYVASRQPVPGAAELLAAVGARARVGIVSNNLLEEQREKLRHCGLEEYCEVLVVSEEVGVSKPDPRIFQVALSRLGSVADHAVMVGDSWTADVMGAIAAGIRPVWFNRTGLPMPAAHSGVAVITSLERTAETMTTIFDER
ncbi:MAG: HAD-IA family hydrolase [Vicinamibacterales bacterium]